jgi:hypothetical protein
MDFDNDVTLMYPTNHGAKAISGFPKEKRLSVPVFTEESSNLKSPV